MSELPLETTDEEIRTGVRQAMEQFLKKLRCGGDVEQQWFYKSKFIRKLRDYDIAIDTDAANAQHYEVPTEFYKNCLGKHLKYSGCYWPKQSSSLDEAEAFSLDEICQRAGVTNGQRIMDLGCGWGSLTLHLLKNYPDCYVTSLSNSSTQGAYIREQVDELKATQRSTVVTADANYYNTTDKYDRVISIEMLEHMKNYERLFSRIAGWLTPGGRMFCQILCHREFCYSFNTAKGSDTEWMAKYFFSGGTMPSADMFAYFQRDLVLIDSWRTNGTHYSRTLEAWLKLADQNMESIKSIMRETYGEEAERHIFNWRMFFIFCSEVFAYDEGNQWMVAHHLFEKRNAADEVE